MKSVLRAPSWQRITLAQSLLSLLSSLGVRGQQHPAFCGREKWGLWISQGLAARRRLHVGLGRPGVTGPTSPPGSTCCALLLAGMKLGMGQEPFLLCLGPSGGLAGRGESLGTSHASISLVDSWDLTAGEPTWSLSRRVPLRDRLCLQMGRESPDLSLSP